MKLDPNAPLRHELHCFVRNRWQASVVLVAGALVAGLIQNWPTHDLKIATIGVLIFFYNLPFALLLRRAPHWLDKPRGQKSLAWIQITLDLIALSAVVTLSGGVYSPVLGFFVLHMIFASMLLVPPIATPYAAWALALVILSVALKFADLLPTTVQERLVALGWAGTLGLTVYFTSHVARNMRINLDRTRSILNTVPNGIVTVTRTGAIRLANAEALHMFGLSNAHIQHVQLDELINFEIPLEQVLTSWKPTPADRPAHSMTTTARRSDGTEFPVEVMLQRMDAGPRDSYTVVIRDRTERQRVAHRLDELNAEMHRQREALLQHEKMIAVGRMASGVAHEIANPLANMDGLIQLIERSPERMDEDTPKLLRDQIRRISEIVRQLKDFAHPAVADQKIIFASDVVRSAIELLRFDARREAILFDQELSSCTCCVSVHPQAIEQVIVNILLNALDAVAECKHPRVEVSITCLPNQWCQIAIKDNGSGIAEGDLSRVFEPFFTTKSPGMGTGLGLAISYTLVEREGGKIQIESTQGEGTTVSIFFPTHQPPSDIGSRAASFPGFTSQDGELQDSADNM